MAVEDWTQTEISHGRFKTTNGTVTISVMADFSGYVENEDTGDFIEFKDLRTLIEGAKVLEKALVDHYGGWK
jgi:hypothetical protein